MDFPFTEHEKRFVLGEVIKTSRVSLDVLLNFIHNSNIEPNFGDLVAPPGRTPNQVYTIYQELSTGGGPYKRKDQEYGVSLPNKKARTHANGQASPAVSKTPKTPKTAAAPTTNGNTPTTADGEKRKRGRPSKADLALRAAQSGETPKASPAGAAPVANMGGGAVPATPGAKRRGRPTKAEVLMRQTVAEALGANQIAAEANTEDPEEVAAANETIEQADEAMEVMEAAGMEAGAEDAAHEVDDEVTQETDLQKSIDEDPDFA